MSVLSTFKEHVTAYHLREIDGEGHLVMLVEGRLYPRLDRHQCLCVV